MRAYVMASGTDTHPQIVTGGGGGGVNVLVVFCLQGLLPYVAFRLGDFWSGDFCPGAFCRKAFDLEPLVTGFILCTPLRCRSDIIAVMFIEVISNCLSHA